MGDTDMARKWFDDAEDINAGLGSVINRAIADAISFEAAIAIIRERFRKQEIEVRYSGGDEVFHDTARWVMELGELYNECRELREHACEFGDNDYCSVCGLDGRA